MGQHSSKFMLPRLECMIPSHVRSTFLFVRMNDVMLKVTLLSVTLLDIKRSIFFYSVLNLKYNELNKRKTSL